MLYYYSLFFSIMLIIIISLAEFFLLFNKKKFKKKKILFFDILKINFIFNLQNYLTYVYFFFIFLFEIYLLLHFFNNYSLILNFQNIMIDVFQSLFYNHAFCAGVPKLVNEAKPFIMPRPENQICDIYKYTQMLYTDLNKYSFPLLIRKDVFLDRNTYNEMGRIRSSLYSIYTENIEISKKLYNFCKTNELTDENIMKINYTINELIKENNYKLSHLERCNKKFGILLYNKLYYTAISKKILPFSVDILNNICFFLFGEKNAASLIGDTLNINKNNKLVVVAIEDNSYFTKVYLDYSKCMLKAKTNLELSNIELNKIKTMLNCDLKNLVTWQDQNFELSREWTYMEFVQEKFTRAEIVVDANKFITKPIIDQNIILKYNALDNIFYNSLKSDSTMLRDIEFGKSGMKIDFKQLLEIINDPHLEEFFDKKTKNRIFRASIGDFSLKKPPS